MCESMFHHSIGKQNIISSLKANASSVMISIIIIGSWLSLVTIYLFTRPIQMMRESVL